MSDCSFWIEGSDNALLDSSCTGSPTYRMYSMGYGSYGQLGLGNFDERTDQPTAVPSLEADVIDMSRGTYHTVVLMKDGTVKLTGSNWYGELGTGDGPVGTDVNLFQSPNPLPGVVTAIGGGYCTSFVVIDDKLYACGLGQVGGLGTENEVDLHEFTHIESAPSGIVSVKGGWFQVMLLTDSGELWGAGKNNYGCLGLGHQNITYGFELLATNVVDYFIQADHSVIVKEDGNAYMAGRMKWAGLDDVATSTVFVFAFGDCAEAGVGMRHTVYRKNDGTLYAGGDNSYGQLGINTWEHHYDDIVPCQTFDQGPLGSMEALSVGDYHTLAYHGIENLEDWQWTYYGAGQNFAYGQLGQDTGSSNVEWFYGGGRTEVEADEFIFTRIIAGEHTSFILRQNGWL